MGIDSQTITVIASILIPTLGGFAWIIHRMDARFEKMEARMDSREMRMDSRMSSIESRISNIESKLTAIDMRTSFIERLLEMFRFPQISQKEIKETRDP